MASSAPSNHLAKRSDGVVMIPSERDILLAPGHQSNYHPGNIYYRNYVDQRKEVYKQLKWGDKAQFCQDIVRELTVDKGLRLLQLSDDKRGWIVIDKSLAAEKVMIRLRSKRHSIININNTHTPIIVPVKKCFLQFSSLSDTRDPKSFIVTGFMEEQKELDGSVETIFDNLFIPASHGPATGGPGISLSMDSPRGNKPKLNIDRASYCRNNFGKDVMPTNKANTVRRATYGTGSGIRTHGTPLE